MVGETREHPCKNRENMETQHKNNLLQPENNSEREFCFFKYTFKILNLIFLTQKLIHELIKAMLKCPLFPYPYTLRGVTV